MAAGMVIDRDRGGTRSVAAARSEAAQAVSMLAEAERLRAEAAAKLIDFDVLDGHIAEGYATPQRHLIHQGKIAARDANRLHRVIRFAADHTMVADALQAGEITIDHADLLRTAAAAVGAELFDDAVFDLLAAARDVDLEVFEQRLETWTWRMRPEQTADEVEAVFENRSLTTQRDVFGGGRGRFSLDAAGMASLELALETTPDPVDSLHPRRTLAQRKADRLVELADLANTSRCYDTDAEPTGVRMAGGRSIDVIIDLPTLVGGPFSLDDHRGPDGEVDWVSLRSELTAWGNTPRPVLEEFLCDASWRQLITSGARVVLDYNTATPDIASALRRAIRRRDGCCQFAGCDRRWQWCDVHHLVPREQGGPTNEQNLALVCRFHHRMIHQQGWKLLRQEDGRLLTVSP